jgi:predicted nucleic acid-binding protein
MATLVDTGPLFALANQGDHYHEPVKQYLLAHPDTWIVPAPVVADTCIRILDRLGPDAELSFLRSLARREMLVEAITDVDLGRAIEILERYRDARFGMVDAASMAIAERLKIDVILTLDRRDFTIYRPRHCDAFRLVPPGIR